MNTTRGWHRLFVALFMFGLLSGCSFLSLSYNYADWILFWKIDQYFDLTAEQRTALEPHISEFHQWHREHELPLYKEFLQTIYQDWQDGFTPDEVQRIFSQFHHLQNNLAKEIASEGTPFLVSLHPSQLHHFQDVARERNEELWDELGRTYEKRMIRKIERYLDLLNDWVGELSSEQEAVIAQVIREFPDTTSFWIRSRAERQQQFVNLLKTERNPLVIEQAVGRWLLYPQQFPGLTAKEREQAEETFYTGITKIDQLLTVEQRHLGLAKLQDLIDDVESLAFP